MASSPANPTTISQLPEPVLVHMLRHLPQQERLSSCALVGKAWAAAAAAATTAAAVGTGTDEQLASFNSWVKQHAQRLTNIHTVACGPSRFGLGPRRNLLLPALGLLHLQALVASSVQLQWQWQQDGVSVISSSSSSSSGTDVVLPALLDLELYECEVHPSDITAMQLQQLTRLSLMGVQPSSGLEQQEVSAAVVALLRQLPQLSTLEWDMGVFGDVAPFSTMQHLQSCSLTGDPAVKLLEAMCAPCLKELCLSLFSSVLSPSVLPSGGWPSLLHLSLLSGGMQPPVLAQLPQLQSLRLVGTWLLPPGAQVGNANDEESEVAAGTAEFMAALAQLTALTSLTLDNVYVRAVDQEQLQRFSALTACSRLQVLEMSTEDIEAQPLPQHAAQHMFGGEGRLLPHLTRLTFSYGDRDGEVPLVLPAATALENFWCLDAADLDSIAACCPGLKSVELLATMRSSPEVMGSLLRLQQVSVLSVGGPCITDDEGPTLAQMTGLEELCVLHAPNFTVQGLQHLTALQQLTSLRAVGCGFFDSSLVDDEQPTLHFADRTQKPDGPPDVWQQLDSWLDECPESAPGRLKEQRRVNAQLQEQLAAAEARHQAELAAAEARHQAEVASAAAGGRTRAGKLELEEKKRVGAAAE